MVSSLSPLLAEVSAWTSGWRAGVAVAIIVLVAIVAYWLFIRHRNKRAEEEALKRAREKLPPKESAAVVKAEAELDRLKREHEAADLKAKQEAEARTAKEAAAKAEAEEHAQARLEATQRAASLREQAKAAPTEKERRDLLEAAAKADADAARHQKAEDQARRRAGYEARKAQGAEEKTKRFHEEEEKKREEVEAARKKAEAEALEAAKRQLKIEAESGRTLAEGLEKTRGGFMARLAKLVGASTTLDDQFMGELEEILFTADIGVRTATRMLDVVREKLKRKELANPEKVKAALREEIERIVTLDYTYTSGGMPPAKATPQTLMIVGVNGSGKTTTIGKLAFKERVNGRNVLLGAGDTFRAAAAEQLDVWAARAQVDIVKGPPDSDPASVCFDAVKKAVTEQRDLVILDTAGRLHTQVNLMAELQKVKRVVDKAMPGAPHEIWLVVDGTTGQNALVQARQFHEALGLTGLVLTKLDGTAKGGVVIGICDELKVPIRFVGVGEKIGDLRPFSPKEFVEALFAE